MGRVSEWRCEYCFQWRKYTAYLCPGCQASRPRPSKVPEVIGVRHSGPEVKAVCHTGFTGGMVWTSAPRPKENV